MKQLYIVIGIILIIWGLLFFLKSKPIEKPQEIKVAKNGIVVTTSTGTKVIPIPRTGKVIITSTEVIPVGFMPNLCFLPKIGIATGSQLSPLIGFQFLRLEPLQLGLALNLTTENLDISIDKDVFYNSLVGVYMGINKGGYSQYGLMFSVFI